MLLLYQLFDGVKPNSCKTFEKFGNCRMEKPSRMVCENRQVS